MITRRSLITGLIALVAAPAIVRCGSLMPVKAMVPEQQFLDILRLRIADAEAVMMRAISQDLYSDADLKELGGSLVEDIGHAVRSDLSKAFMPRLHRETWRVRGWEVRL